MEQLVWPLSLPYASAASPHHGTLPQAGPSKHVSGLHQWSFWLNLATCVRLIPFLSFSSSYNDERRQVLSVRCVTRSDWYHPYRYKEARRFHGFEGEACHPLNDGEEVDRLGAVIRQSSRLGYDVERVYQISSTRVGGCPCTANYILRLSYQVLNFESLTSGRDPPYGAIDFARSNSSAQVIGISLSAIQSTTSVRQLPILILGASQVL